MIASQMEKGMNLQPFISNKSSCMGCTYFGYSSLFRRFEYSKGLLFRRFVIPKVRYYEGPLLRRSVILKVRYSEDPVHYSEDPLIRRLVNPKMKYGLLIRN